MTDASETKKKKIPVWVWIVGGVLVLGGIGSLLGGEDDPVSTEAESPSAAEEVDAGAETLEEEPALEPTSFANIQELEAAIESEFGGQTNMDLPRDLSVGFEEESGWLNVSYVLDENFTKGLTRSGAWSDIHRIFELARMSDFVNELTVAGMFPLINNLGEELGPQNVVVAYFDPEVYPKINLDNLIGERLSGAATNVVIHPAFQD